MVRWGRTRRRQQRELENLRGRLEDSNRRIERLEGREKLLSRFAVVLVEHLDITPAEEE